MSGGPVGKDGSYWAVIKIQPKAGDAIPGKKLKTIVDGIEKVMKDNNVDGTIVKEARAANHKVLRALFSLQVDDKQS
jgi:hypothetical protein